MALVTSLLALALFSSVGATAVYYANTGSASASFSLSSQRTQAVAEAGNDLARATLFNAADPRNPNAVPQQTVVMDGGTVTYSGTYSSATQTWTLQATGSMPNPTGAAAIRRSVASQVRVTTGQQGTSNNAVWNYLYADNPGTCTQFTNNVSIDVSLYLKGDLCLTNNAEVSGAQVNILGTVTITNNASIGDNGSPIQEAHISNGCRYGSSPLHIPCTAGDRVYAETVDTSPITLSKPPVDLAYWYPNAKPGPTQPCTIGSFPGGFDNDAVMNKSRGLVDLTPTTPYDCRVTDASGNVIGQLTWTPSQGSTPGTLVVAGTIFFDGDIEMAHNSYAVYQGKATIHASGTIRLHNNAKLCGVSGCGATWDPNTNMLALVSGEPAQGEGVEIANNAKFQGAIYAVSDFRQWNNATVWGPVIADELRIENNADNHFMPYGSLLPGMPATYEPVPVLVNVGASYSG